MALAPLPRERCVSPELGSQAHQARFEPGFAWVPPPSSDGLPTFPPLFRLSGCSEPYAQPSHEVFFFFFPFFAATFNFN